MQNGTIAFGGATLDSPIKDGEKMQSNGSAMIVCADTEEEARGIVAGDVYAKEGIWNVEGAQIWAFKSAVRQAL